MKEAMLCAIALLAATTVDLAKAKATEISSDEILARIEAIEKKNAARTEAIEKENALLKQEVADLRKHITPQLKHSSAPENHQPKITETAAPTSSDANAQSLGMRSWAGIYGGLHVGKEWAHITGVETPLAGGGTGFDYTDQPIRRWLGGGQLGVNIEYGRTVLGTEVSGSWGNLNSSQTATPTSGASSCFQNTTLKGFVAPASLTCNARIDWTLQSLVRGGYTFLNGQLLPYLKTGVALSKVNILYEYNQPPTLPSLTWGGEKVFVGGVLAGGLEFALSNKLSAGIEYSYTQYASQSFAAFGTGVMPNGRTFTDPVSTSNHSLTAQTVQLFMNYQLYH
jgi:opacity protein-like surface antigen